MTLTTPDQRLSNSGSAGAAITQQLVVRNDRTQPLQQVVVSATFALAAGDPARSEAELAEIVRWRREHQPGGQNCGSVFVNPLPRSAGELIDSLGLRGRRVGTAMVSPKHANFIQADVGGRADDVFELMREVRAEVLARCGVALRSEVRLVGFEQELNS